MSNDTHPMGPESPGWTEKQIREKITKHAEEYDTQPGRDDETLKLAVFLAITALDLQHARTCYDAVSQAKELMRQENARLRELLRECYGVRHPTDGYWPGPHCLPEYLRARITAALEAKS